MSNLYYSKDELINIGFKSVGSNNKISRLSKFYAIDGSSLGNNNRIDDFCLFKGKIKFGNFIHVAGFCLFSGVGSEIVIGNYSGFSSHCSIWTATEDFVNPTLTSPSIDKNFSTAISGGVIFEESVKVGTQCVFLPNIKVGFGSSIAANTIVSRNIKTGSIVGPKNRHHKLYGFRKVDKIKLLKSKFEKDI